MNKRSFGREGEQYAVEFLEKNGYQIITKNFQIGRLGEIDIIAKHKEYLCFIEVKSRSNDHYGTPAESVTKSKQRSIIRLAQLYLARNRIFEVNVRFDVIEIYFEKNPTGIGKRMKEIGIIQNAFYSR